MSAGDGLARLTAALERAGHPADRGKATCPAHDDSNPSLSIGQGRDGALVKCQAGCETDSVLEALAMSAADLFDAPRDQARRGEWTPFGDAVAVYDYTSAQGTLLFQVCRTASKQFPQRRPDPSAKSGWRWKLGGTGRVLYRLPKVIEAVRRGETIWIVEGEKDVHAIEAAGAVATCNPGGTGSGALWEHPGFTAPLNGATVVIVADKDKSGREHATAAVAAGLQGVTASARIVEAAAGKDAADHLAAGHGLGDFIEIDPADRLGELDDADPEPRSALDRIRASRINWTALYGADFTKVDWIPGQLMTRGQQISIIGSGKAGKSLLCQEWAWRAAAGLPFLGDTARLPVRCLYIDAENGQPDLQARFLSFGARLESLGTLDYLSFPPFAPLDTAAGGAELLCYARDTRPEVIWLDTVSRFISGPENDSDTWLALYRHTLLPLKSEGIGSVWLDHFGKDTGRGGRGSSAKSQDVDHVWELTSTDGLIVLKRTDTRTGLGPDLFHMRREATREGDHWKPGATRHVSMAGNFYLGVDLDDLIAKIDSTGIPATAGRDKVKAACIEAGVSTPGNDVLARAIQIRKARTVSGSSRNVCPGRVGGTDVPGPVLDAQDSFDISAGQTCPGQFQDRTGQAVAGPVLSSPSLRGGQDRTAPCPDCGWQLDSEGHAEKCEAASE